MTAGSLTENETSLIARLVAGGLTRPVATLAVVLCTREHARPTAELAHVIRQYQSLEEARTAETTLAELRGLRWLAETEIYGVTLSHAAVDLGTRLSEVVGDPLFEGDLMAARAVAGEGLRIVGQMNESVVYGTYLDLLREAQSSIRLPMLATTPDLASAEILKERARMDVSVRILLGHPDVVVSYRGAAQRQTARDSIEGWVNHARGLPNMKVRLCRDRDDMVIATCLSVDDRVLRFDVYDPERQRSLEGVMLEVRSSSGQTPNLHRLFARSFDEAWDRAQPTGFVERARRRFSLSWPWAAVVPSVIVCVVAKGAGATGAISAAVAGSFVFAGLVDHRPAWLRMPHFK